MTIEIHSLLNIDIYGDRNCVQQDIKFDIYIDRNGSTAAILI